MSKSEPNSAINIFDEPDVIRQKLASAVTATDAPEGQMPSGVSNLFNLLLEFGQKEDYNKFTRQYKEKTIKYSDLKEVLSKSIADYFAPIREKRAQLENKNFDLSILKKSTAKASAAAKATLKTVKEKIGLV